MNAFLSRELKPGSRPQDDPSDPAAVTSAADCRLTVFQNITLAQKYWIKVRLHLVCEVSVLRLDLAGPEILRC